LDILAGSPDESTRLEVAGNEYCSHAALRTLSQDTNMDIANEARENGRARGLDVDAIELDDPSEDLVKMAQDMGLTISNAPTPMAAEERNAAMTSADATVRESFAEREDLEPNEETLLAFDPDDKVVRAVARRDSLRESVATVLLNHANPIVQALACRRAPVVECERFATSSDDSLRMMVARVAKTATIQVQLAADSSIKVRRGLASQARTLCDEAVAVLSCDQDSEVRKLVVLNSLSSSRYGGQNVTDLIEWREELWREALESRLTPEEFGAIDALLDTYPGTFDSLCKLAKALV
jgi:hypothetical protein